MFFSVDVETSSTNPFKGDLLTVGAVAVYYFGNEWFIDEDSAFYERIANENPVWDVGTLNWWVHQDDVAKDEIFDPTLERINPVQCALALRSWVTSYAGGEDGFEAHFVANPVSFDKPWIDKLFAQTNAALNPFHWRSLCLRSMKYGLRKNSEFGSDRENYDPTVPHHALHDAIAQAKDLVAMLNERDLRYGDWKFLVYNTEEGPKSGWTTDSVRFYEHRPDERDLRREEPISDLQERQK